MSIPLSSSDLWREIEEVPGELFDEDVEMDYDDQSDFGLSDLLSTGNDF